MPYDTPCNQAPETRRKARSMVVARKPCYDGPSCKSSDGVVINIGPKGEYYAKCFVCETRYRNNRLRDLYPELKIPELQNWEKTDFSMNPKKEKEKQQAKAVSRGELQTLFKETSAKGRGFRGISDRALKHFGIRTEYDQTTGKVLKRHYITLTDKKPTGIKTRVAEPKDFYTSGGVGQGNDLFGAFRFPNGAKTTIIVGGEEDAAATHDMLNPPDSPYPVVQVLSPTVGESGLAEQLKVNYAELDKSDKIIICMDSDPAGEKAAETALEALPLGKAWLMHCPAKDPNKALQDGLARDFVTAYLRAKRYVPSGIVGSGELYKSVVDSVNMEKIPFPPILVGLENYFAGGIPLGEIVTIAGRTGEGKTTVINEILYYWIFNSPHRMGIVSLELDKGQYGKALLSRHMGKKIDLIKDRREAADYLGRDDVVAQGTALFETEDGNDRFMLMDDRGGDAHTLQKKVEEMIVGCDVKVIVLDPLQDILDGMSNEEQSLFMGWQKRLVKSHKVSFINISHMRKDAGKDADGIPQESDIHGSSAISKSSSAVVLLWRDKNSDNPVTKNTTYIRCTKCRWTGETGMVAPLIYENASHTLFSRDSWRDQQRKASGSGTDTEENGEERNEQSSDADNSRDPDGTASDNLF